MSRFPPPIPVEPFRAMIVARRAYALAAQGRRVFHMEFGQPSCGAPPAAIAAAQSILANDPQGYFESAPLRARIAALYNETHGVAVDPARVILTCGASPALVLALTSALRPGCRVAMARPGYVAYRNTVAALGMVPVEIACGAEAGFQLTATALAALDPAPAAVIVASPANPTGTIIPPAELARIAAVARERSIRIISDEIYHGIAYGLPTETLLAHEPDALIVNSFSKFWAMPGWRLGWLVAPDDLIDAAYARMSNLMLTPPVLAQHAALAAMDEHAVLAGHVADYAANRAEVLAALPSLGLAHIAPPDGAFYIWADVTHLIGPGGFADSVELALALLEATGVATAPGVDFDPIDGARFLRLSFAVSREEVREGLARMVPWFAAAVRVK